MEQDGVCSAKTNSVSNTYFRCLEVSERAEYLRLKGY